MSELIDLAPGIMLATSEHDSTNTVVLASISEALIVDPAWSPSELDDLAGQLADRGLRTLAGISTHAHHDHLLWHPGFGSAPRFASRSTRAIAAARRDPLLAEHHASLNEAPRPELDALFAQLTATPHAPADPDSIWLPRGTAPQGFRPELIVHNAHIPGHTALWLPDQRILISGDMLSDVEPPLLDDLHSEHARILGRLHGDPITDYRAGLDTLEPYVRQARVIIPGHGGVGVDGITRLERDRERVEELARGAL